MHRYFAPRSIAKRDKLLYLSIQTDNLSTFAHYKDGSEEPTGAFALGWVEQRVKDGSWVEMPMPPLHISELEFDSLCARDAFGNHPDILLARISRFMRAQQFHKIAERLEDMTATHRASLKKFLTTDPEPVKLCGTYSPRNTSSISSPNTPK